MHAFDKPKIKSDRSQLGEVLREALAHRNDTPQRCGEANVIRPEKLSAQISLFRQRLILSMQRDLLRSQNKFNSRWNLPDHQVRRNLRQTICAESAPIGVLLHP